MHRTGKVVRIAPNHISIADPLALQVVYAVRILLFVFLCAKLNSTSRVAR
jgi:hypothetical protein